MPALAVVEQIASTPLICPNSNRPSLTLSWGSITIRNHNVAIARWYSPLFTFIAIKPLLLFLVALLALPACKKDDTDPNGLPAATQEGKNTAGFLLNGQLWLPKRSPTSAQPFGVSWSQYLYKGRRALQVNFSRYQSRDDLTALNFIFHDVCRAGTFALNQDIDPVLISGPRPPYAVYSIYEPGPDRKFYTGAAARGEVIITRFDTVARVVSGTFEAKLKEDSGPDSLAITQGRFDIKF